MNTRYVNVHIIHPLPFSNPNRDETGAPKTAVYGGTVRGRLSSQSSKRAARTAFEAQSDGDLTHRTKFGSDHLAARVHELLTHANVTLDDDQQAALAKSIKDEIGKLTGKKDDAKDTLVWIAESELNAVAEKIASKHTGNDILLQRTDIDAVLSTSTESLTIAAFGRMLANRPDLQIEAATQVAHAFTTHTQEIDLDYFTAVDDLQASYDLPDEEGNVKGAGAGHLDVAEYHSGVFYRYFNINRDDLVTNWAPLQRNDDDAGDRLVRFVEAMVRELPTGKDATAAHQTAPAYVLVTFAPRGTSYAPAFERPVSPTRDDHGYIDPSVEALKGYAAQMRAVDGEIPQLTFSFEGDGSVSLPSVYRSVADWIVHGTLPDTV